MGASSSKEEKLQSIKRKLLFQVEYNKNKLKLMNDELTKMEMKIEIGEADIAQNQFVLSEIELNSKARMLSEIKKDKARKEKSIQKLSNLNEAMKNNLEMLEIKIQEYRAAQSIKEANSIFKDIEKMDFSKTYDNNANNLLKHKQQDNEIMANLEIGNKQYLNDGDNEVESPEDILNRLIGQGKPAPV